MDKETLKKDFDNFKEMLSLSKEEFEQKFPGDRWWGFRMAREIYGVVLGDSVEKIFSNKIWNEGDTITQELIQNLEDRSWFNLCSFIICLGIWNDIATLDKEIDDLKKGTN